MSTQIVKSAIKHHNQSQLEYFGQKIKKTMIPVDSPYVNRHVTELINHAGLERVEKVLEVGCGMGKFTLPLLRRGFNITGLDLSPFLLQNLLTYNENKFPVELICSDILDIPPEYNEKFDKVVGFFTLHHFLNLGPYFQAMSRVLKPGGTITFIEPNAYNPLYYIQIFITPGMSWKGDKGVAQMVRRNFESAAQFAQLGNVSIEKYGFFPPFATNKKIGNYCEKGLEKIDLFNPLSAFLAVKIEKPGIDEH